jgi:hypothetical protein
MIDIEIYSWPCEKKQVQGKDCEYDSALYVLSALGKPIEKYVQEGYRIRKT